MKITKKAITGWAYDSGALARIWSILRKLPLPRNEFTSSNNTKKFFYKNYEQILKNQEIQFSQKTAQAILVAKVYVIDEPKEVMKKN